MSLGHALGEIDGHLGVDKTSPWGVSSPLFCGAYHGQIQHFQQAVIVGVYRVCLGHFARLAVVALNGISGVN